MCSKLQVLRMLNFVIISSMPVLFNSSMIIQYNPASIGMMSFVSYIDCQCQFGTDSEQIVGDFGTTSWRPYEGVWGCIKQTGQVPVNCCDEFCPYLLFLSPVWWTYPINCCDESCRWYFCASRNAASGHLFIWTSFRHSLKVTMLSPLAWQDVLQCTSLQFRPCSSKACRNIISWARRLSLCFLMKYFCACEERHQLWAAAPPSLARRWTLMFQLAFAVLWTARPSDSCTIPTIDAVDWVDAWGSGEQSV